MTFFLCFLRSDINTYLIELISLLSIHLVYSNPAVVFSLSLQYLRRVTGCAFVYQVLHCIFKIILGLFAGNFKHETLLSECTIILCLASLHVVDCWIEVNVGYTCVASRFDVVGVALIEVYVEGGVYKVYLAKLYSECQC